MCWPISSTGYVINYDAELKNVTAALWSWEKENT
jgi:hypothetical protein